MYATREVKKGFEQRAHMTSTAGGGGGGSGERSPAAPKVAAPKLNDMEKQGKEGGKRGGKCLKHEPAIFFPLFPLFGKGSKNIGPKCISRR